MTLIVVQCWKKQRVRRILLIKQSNKIKKWRIKSLRMGKDHIDNFGVEEIINSSKSAIRFVF
jgi:nicotinic acid phosphoribosyltransferase